MKGVVFTNPIEVRVAEASSRKKILRSVREVLARKSSEGGCASAVLGGLFCVALTFYGTFVLAKFIPLLAPLLN